jgi:hypothetical protein
VAYHCSGTLVVPDAHTSHHEHTTDVYIEYHTTNVQVVNIVQCRRDAVFSYYYA